MSSEYAIDDVRITSADRLVNSHYGNPRWRLNTNRGTFLTENDSQVNYSIDNLSNSRHPETFAIGDDAPPVTLLIREHSRGGDRVIGIERNKVALR